MLFLIHCLTGVIRTMYLSLLLGVILISLALCADGAIGNVQEKAMKQHEASNTEIVRKIVFPRKQVLQTFEKSTTRRRF